MVLAFRNLIPTFFGALLLVGCPPTGDTPPPPPPPVPEAGPVGSDGAPDAAPSPTNCGCPIFPDVCEPPEPGVPTFSPAENDEAFSAQLAHLLVCAGSGIRAALYQTTSECIADLFQSALDQNPSLQLDLVIDDDQCPRVAGVLDCPLSRIDDHERVNIVADERSDLMHHKFIIADDRRVWVSSANMTAQSFCRDHNNSIIIEEPGVVAAFETEFQRMFEFREFGPAPATEPTQSDIYTLYFSPQSPASSPARWFTDLIAAIDAAETSIDFMVFALTRQEVGEAIVRAHERGVRVQGIVAHRFSTEAAVATMISGGVSVRFGDVHHKVAVIDDLVIAGSANWSRSAWSNNENSLWIADASVASLYRIEVEAVFAISDETGTDPDDE